jgi:hypothetical protein
MTFSGLTFQDQERISIIFEQTFVSQQQRKNQFSGILVKQNFREANSLPYSSNFSETYSKTRVKYSYDIIVK